MAINFCYIFLAQILLIHASIPNWDVDNLSVDLFSSSSTKSTYSYCLYNENGYNLTKKITKNADGTLSSTNELTYNSRVRAVEFEGIGSYHYDQLGCYELVCPKGSFHPYCFYTGEYIKPSGFEGSSWELSCFSHGTGYFLVFYLHNGGNSLYYVKGNNQDFKKSPSFENLFAYKLYESTNKGDNNYNYDFPSLQKRGNNLVISGYGLIMNSNENTINGNGEHGQSTITEAKAYTQGSIDSNYNYYYFTYNNVSDFASGYSNSYIDTLNDKYADVSTSITNTDSPLTFVDNVEILEMNFIPGTKNVYYKI